MVDTGVKQLFFVVVPKDAQSETVGIMVLHHGAHLTSNDANRFNTWSFILHIATTDEIVETAIRHATSGVGAKAKAGP